MPRKFSHRDLTRATRTVAVAHAEAFQLMRYASPDAPALWIWNSRDGVTPFGMTINDQPAEYRHAMNSYTPTYSAILPDAASHVWVDYDRDAWAAMQTRKFELFSAMKDRPEFAELYPTLDAWLGVSPFEAGQPRLLTRAEFLETTASYAGRYAEGEKA